MVLVLKLFQGPTFHEPPSQAPAFQEWNKHVNRWTNATKEPATLLVPANIELRGFLNERGVCRKNNAACRVRFVYELTINARAAEHATLAVVRYVIRSDRGSVQTCSWSSMDMLSRRYFVLTDDAWAEIPKDERSGFFIRKMTDAIFTKGMHALSSGKEK
jgi:hypothetical protein